MLNVGRDGFPILFCCVEPVTVELVGVVATGTCGDGVIAEFWLISIEQLEMKNKEIDKQRARRILIIAVFFLRKRRL